MGLCLAVGVWSCEFTSGASAVGVSSLGTGGSVQSFLEGITTVHRHAFGQGAKFGTVAVSTLVNLRGT